VARTHLTIAVAGVAAWLVAGPGVVRAQDGDAEEPVFGARAVVSEPEPSHTELELSETRDVAGGLGDPLRVLDSLPGVVPVYTGLPYVYVRGAPPSGSRYYFDDVPLPQLFHAALGPSVIHPRFLGNMSFHPGVAPARHGGHLGAVITADPAEGSDEVRGEVDLRMIDVTGFVDVPLEGGGRIAAAGRFGYPRSVLFAISPDTHLWYGDYQAKVELPLSHRDRFELVWLGSYDYLDGILGVSGDFGVGITLPPDFAMQLSFHRLDLRFIRETERGQMGAAVRFGYDHTSFEEQLRVNMGHVAPRVWWENRFHRRVKLRVGAEMAGWVGNLHNPAADASELPQGSITLPPEARVPTRSTTSAYVEARLLPVDTLALEVGVRGDVWIEGERTDVSADPRARMTWSPHERLDVHVGAGLAHQIPIFLVPLPGLERVAVAEGLQRVVQTDAGFGVALPAHLRVEARGYFHQYYDALINRSADFAGSPERADVQSYGAELFLRRDASQPVSGWVSYGLGRSSATSPEGDVYVPPFDVRHVLNVVTRLRLGKRVTVSSRFHARSGTLVNQTIGGLRPSGQQVRLPWFVRLDLRLAYGWKPSWGSAELYLDWLNASFTREPVGAECLFGQCSLVQGPLIVLPSIGFRASL
jgi:hypothetical protein